MNRRAFVKILAVVALPLMPACAPNDTIEAVPTEAVKRVFKQPYDDVFGAAVAAAEKRQLEVVSAARESGNILLNSRPSLNSIAGERITISVARLSDRTTSIEIVSRPGVAAISFPRDWPVLLFGEIEEELATRRLKR